MKPTLEHYRAGLVSPPVPLVSLVRWVVSSSTSRKGDRHHVPPKYSIEATPTFWLHQTPTLSSGLDTADRNPLPY